MFYDIRLVDFDPDDGDAVNPCPTSGILSSKTARSVNPRYRNLISYGIKGDTSARPWEVAQQIKPEIFKSDIYL